MDRIFIVVLCLLIGAGGAYLLIPQNPMPNPIVVIKEPNYRETLRTADVISQNTTIATKKNKNQNNAVALLQTTSKTLIGVDFTDFNWSQLSGFGTELQEGHLNGDSVVTIKGTLPELKVLDHFDVPGTTTREVLSRIIAFDEDKLLTLAEKKKAETDACIQDRILYQAEILENAKETVVSILSAVMPRKSNGAALVEFDLTFKNESEFKDQIAKISADDHKPCSQMIYVY